MDANDTDTDKTKEDLSVRKVDGTLESWNTDKLIASMGKVGIDIEKAEAIADELLSWSISSSENGVIDSQKLKSKVITEIQIVDPAAAENYRVYKK